ncbi:hypothetical protein DHD80_04885 [Gramella sp. AN32]|nr:hypothetical protein [Gramella sp. AN32]
MFIKKAFRKIFGLFNQEANSAYRTFECGAFINYMAFCNLTFITAWNSSENYTSGRTSKVGSNSYRALEFLFLKIVFPFHVCYWIFFPCFPTVYI